MWLYFRSLRSITIHDWDGRLQRTHLHDKVHANLEVKSYPNKLRLERSPFVCQLHLNLASNVPNKLRLIPKAIHSVTVPAITIISMNLNSQAIVKWCKKNLLFLILFLDWKVGWPLNLFSTCGPFDLFYSLTDICWENVFFLCHQHICFRLLSFVKLIESPLVRQKPLPQSCLRTCGRLQLKERGKQISSLPRTSKIAWKKSLQLICIR